MVRVLLSSRAMNRTNIFSCLLLTGLMAVSQSACAIEETDGDDSYSDRVVSLRCANVRPPKGAIALACVDHDDLYVYDYLPKVGAISATVHHVGGSRTLAVTRNTANDTIYVDFEPSLQDQHIMSTDIEIAEVLNGPTSPRVIDGFLFKMRYLGIDRAYYSEHGEDWSMGYSKIRELRDGDLHMRGVVLIWRKVTVPHYPNDGDDDGEGPIE